MVFDRMSNPCLQAIKKAHDIGNEIGLTTMRNEFIFAGIVAQPERAERTLRKYRFESLEVTQAVIRTLKYKPSVDFKPVNPSIDVNNKDPLPFSDESKSTLNKAMQIAERLESKTLRSEYVLLALMGYNNGNKIENVPILEVLGDISTLKRSETDFTITKFCDDLINALPLTPISSSTEGDLIVKDTVVIGSNDRAGSTNTLSEVGVDLTQLALDGKLDKVYGRNQEIKTALRTLGRRRKNNPCLIGEPGQ